MAIAYVSAQSGNAVEGSGSNVSSTTVTVGTAVSSGNTVCIMTSMVPQFAAVSNVQISDNAPGAPNTYTATVKNIDGGTLGYCAFYCANVTGSPTQFTVFDSGGQQFGWLNMSVDTFSGVASVDTVTATNSQQAPGTGTDAITSGSFTPTASGETVWCGLAAWAGGNAAGTNYTLAQKNETTFAVLASEYRLAAPGGAQVATFTNSTNGGTSGDYWDTAVILLVPASGGGTTISPPSAPWNWVGNAPKLNSQLLTVQKAWHWQGNAPELNHALVTVQKAWAWAKNAPTLNFSLATVKKSWAWTGNAPTLVFATLLQPPKAMWSWVARAPLLSGGNIPGKIKAAYNVMLPTIWGVLRGETRDPMY